MFTIGDNVRGLRGSPRTTAVDARNVGQVGEIVDCYRMCGETTYIIQYPWGTDESDECNLEFVS